MSNATVIIGKTKNPNRRSISNTNTPTNKISEAKIIQLLTTIPIPIENPTSPLRYSFLTGLKKVCSSIGTEKKLKNALLKALK